MADDLLDETYAAVRAMLARAAVGMEPVNERPGGVTLLADWPNPAKPKERMWFGGAARMKSYVSVHLMPVYSHPSLLEGLSPALKKRQQGKSCFNLKSPDPDLLAELEALTAKAAALYARPFESAEWGKPLKS